MLSTAGGIPEGIDTALPPPVPKSSSEMPDQHLLYLIHSLSSQLKYHFLQMRLSLPGSVHYICNYLLKTSVCIQMHINFSISSSRLFFFFFLNDSHPNRCEVYLIVILICISLMIIDVEHLFISLLTIWTSSSEKCLFKFFAHFSNWVDFFYCWVEELLYTFLILISYCIYDLQTLFYIP